MLSKELKSSFKLHRTLFMYLPEFIVIWDKDFKTLYLNPSYFSWTVWILGMLDGIIVAGGNIYAVYTHYFVKPRAFRLTTVFIFVAGTIAVGSVIVIALIALRRRKDAMAGFNQAHFLDREMTKKYRPNAYNKEGKYTNEGKIDIFGTFGLIMIFWLGTSGLWMCFFTFIRKSDVFGYIFEDFLPDPKYRDTSTTVLLMVIRVILVAPSVIEIFRSLSFFLLIGLVYFTFQNDCMYYLMKTKSLEEFIHYYILFGLAYCYVETIVGDMLVAVLTVDYFGTLTATSFCIVSYGKLATGMYIFVIAAILLALAITSVAFIQLKTLTNMLDEMLHTRQFQAKRGYAKTKTKHAKIIKQRMGSLRKLEVSFGSFFYMQKDFGLEYFGNLLDHIYEVVLMFDLK